MTTVEALLLTLFWPSATIAFYLLARAAFNRWPRVWLSPLVFAPAILIAIAVAAGESYADYSRATHWLVMMLGPATVAFAVPIYEQRAIIRRHWPALTIGALVGSSAAIASAWALASLLGIDGSLRASLLPRSVSTPFAMIVSADIGGVPDLTAVFVVITGVLGVTIGDGLLRFMPTKSELSRGALFGMGAHGAGVAKAHRIGGEEGTIAGLVMVLVGLGNVLSAPLLSLMLR